MKTIAHLEGRPTATEILEFAKTVGSCNLCSAPTHGHAGIFPLATSSEGVTLVLYRICSIYRLRPNKVLELKQAFLQDLKTSESNDSRLCPYRCF